MMMSRSTFRKSYEGREAMRAPEPSSEAGPQSSAPYHTPT